MATQQQTPERQDVPYEDRARSFQALYDHWERHQWAVSAIDYRRDAASYDALDSERRESLIWVFAHRYHAEFSVATLLAPFLIAAPTYEMQLLLATQIADEYRHMQSVLRIYDEVFGIRGGIQAVKEIADAHLDPVAAYFYERFEQNVRRLERDRHPDTFLRAVLAYHLIAEGVVAKTAQNLTSRYYDHFGDFPGLREGQQLVGRDEARHIGIGVSYARQCILDQPAHTREVITRGLEEFFAVTAQGLTLVTSDLASTVQRGYGVPARAFYDEMLRLMDVRLHSIGLTDE